MSVAALLMATLSACSGSGGDATGTVTAEDSTEGDAAIAEGDTGDGSENTAPPGERSFLTFDSLSNALVWIDSDSGSVSEVSSLETPAGILTLTLGGGSVWLARDDGSITRVSVASGEIEAEIETGVTELPFALSYSDEGLWALHGIPGLAATITLVDPASNAVQQTVAVPEGGNFSDIAAGEGAAWAIGGNTERVTILYRIDPSTGDVTDHETLVIATDVTTGGGYVWFSGFGFPEDGGDGSEGVGRFDPATGETDFFPTGASSESIAFGFDGVWMGDPLGDGGAFVHHLDPDTGNVVASASVGDAYAGFLPIYLGAGFVWAQNTGSEALMYVIDPTTDEIVGSGDSPGGFPIVFP